jgi:hypothetical protein
MVAPTAGATGTCWTAPHDNLMTSLGEGVAVPPQGHAVVVVGEPLERVRNDVMGLGIAGMQLLTAVRPGTQMRRLKSSAALALR